MELRNSMVSCDTAYPIYITRKKIKNMYIRIDAKDASVRVSVPIRASAKEIDRFLENNREWIENHRAKVARRLETRPEKYENGESIRIWGDLYTIEFVPSYCDKGAYIKADKLVILAPLDSDGQLRKKLVDAFLREELSKAIDDLAPEVCALTKKEPDEWHIRDMKTRWGTCNISKKRIWISLMNVHNHRKCLRYVMIHELTHFYAANHGDEFKAYMDRFCPDWREIRKQMKLIEE